MDEGVGEVLTAHDAAGSLSAGVSPDSNESVLIRAVQAGDRDAFERLVRLYDRGVLKLAMNLLRSPEDARDAYQEAFPLAPGWRERNALYQLYHLLNHQLLFGGAYGAQALAIARRFA